MIIVMVDKFTKQRYFVAYIKEILVEDIVQIYVKEIFIRYGTLNKIILNRDIRFVAAF